MGVYKPKGSGNWWYKFAWRGETIRESTKQANKRTAEQMEAARKTQLAKGEVGLKERKKSPTLKAFLQTSFLPYYETTKREEPNTVNFYRSRILTLLKDSELPAKTLEQITSGDIVSYIERRRRMAARLSVATINRELATLKRAFRLAGEWDVLATKPPKISLLDGEQGREHVLTVEQESAYLDAATPLLRTFATIMLDCGLRPDEVYRLQWEQNYRNERILVHTGKTKAARRSIPVTPRVAALLEMQRTASDGLWIFSAPTKTGHIDQSSVKKQHKRAVKESKVTPFVPYDLRHTCLTRWARYLDPFTLKKLAGHESLETTMKYVHLNESDSENRLLEARDKMQKARAEKVQGGHSFGHSHQSEEIGSESKTDKPN
jgi:integrase